jgi:hypothetical protein
VNRDHCSAVGATPLQACTKLRHLAKILTRQQRSSTLLLQLQISALKASAGEHRQHLQDMARVLHSKKSDFRRIAHRAQQCSDATVVACCNRW